jgi:putative sigma-54 modulation protein
MKIQVKGRHVVVTDALRQHAEEKLSRLHRYLQEPHVDDVTRIELELWVEKNRSIADSQVVEATIFTRGPVIRARESSSDMYVAIDLVVEKLERQAKKYRDRIQHRAQRHQGKGLSTSAEAGSGVAAEDDDSVLEGPSLTPIDEGNHKYARVVKSKRFALKPMSIEEATLQLELVGHDFFVFTNSDTNDTNVVYRRNDGHYGLIEPAQA